MKKKNFFKCICINKNTRVVNLDYSSHYLRQVPQEIFNHERTLESLNLDNNNITELTKEIFCCKALRELILSDNELCNLPEAIQHLSHLNTLNISKNNLPDLPENIGNCAHLVSLDASGNVFEQLPDGLCRLTMLQELIVNTAFLTVLPQNIGRLINLRHIEVRENELKALPQNIGCLNSLQYLDVGNNELTELPESLCRLSKLLVLTADKNLIASLPEKIGSCISLQVLELQQNCLAFLPDSICQCAFLNELVVSHNKLKSLPPSIGHLTRLKNLRVNDNLLLSLPESIGQLDGLVEMYLSNNQLSHIPHSTGLLKRLRDLYADCNCIVDVPSEIGSCTSLTILSLRGNKIQNLPDEIGRIPKLKMLNLSNNRVKFLPMSFLKLRELQAVWLNDNQIQPLVHLQSERDVDTGRKCLVCYLLPQMSNTDDPDSMDNDPNAWQLVQDSRPRVVQWHDEATAENKVQSKSKMPKDAPAKQMNSKHTLVRQNKPPVMVKSQPINLNNGDCVMMNTGTLLSNSAPQTTFVGLPTWSNNIPYYPNTMGQVYPINNGFVNRPGSRRMVGGYESDTAAMQHVRSWGRHGNQTMGSYQDGHLARINESVENDSQNGMFGMHGRLQGTAPAAMMMSSNGVGYGRHPAGGGMVGGRQSGYNTDTGLMMNGARNGQRQVRHRPGQSKPTHYRNPFEQLRVIRSSESNSLRRYEVPRTTSISSLPPPPSRQPPQRPLPSPPSSRINLLPQAENEADDNSQTDNWHVQMAANGVVATDYRTANMIIPPPPCRTPPNLSIAQPKDNQPDASTVSNNRTNNFTNNVNYNYNNSPVMIVDLNHPGLTSISPSVIEDPTNRIVDYFSATNPNTNLSTFAVVIVRDKGLGFSITGGVSSNPNAFRPDDKGIFIAKVNPSGPADGRLKVGDKILVVNNRSFIGMEHSTAANILKTCGDIVKMTIDRFCDRDSHI